MQHEWYQQGLAKAKAKDFQGAIAAFTQAILAAPEAIAYYQRGLIWFQLGKLERSIEDYTSALSQQSDPNFAYARSLAHLSAGNLAAAIADAKQTIRFKPDAAAAYELLAMVRQRQGATPQAIACYKRAAEQYLDQRSTKDCRRCLNQIAKLQPPSVSTARSIPPIAIAQFLQQAVQKAKQGNYQAAIEDLNWAIQVDPQNAQAFADRAQVQAAVHPHSAVADYQQAAKLFSQSGNSQMAQQMLRAIESLAHPNLRARPVRPPASAAKPSWRVQQNLLRLVSGDRSLVSRLVAQLKLKHPGQLEDWYWEKALYDLERDRH